MIEQLNLTVWAWIESIRGAGRRGIWTPFLGMALIQGLILLALTYFYLPVLSWLLVPLIRLVIDQPMALHYPQFYIALPNVFTQTNLYSDWLAGSFLFGAAYLLIWRSAAGLPQERTWREVAGAYGKLLLLRLPPLVALLLVYMLVPRLLSQGGELHGNMLRLTRLSSFLLGVLVESLFLYAPLAVLVLRRPVLAALRESVATARRTPLATFLIVLLPNLVQIPLAAIMRRSEGIVQNLVPEIVAWLLLGTIVLYVLINYFTIASSVRVFGARSPALREVQS